MQRNLNKIVCLFLIFFFVNLAKATEDRKGYYTGIVRFKNDDSLITVIHLDYYKDNYIKYLYLYSFGEYMDAKNKIRKLNPNKIKGFDIIINNVYEYFISLPKEKKSKKKLFYHLVNAKNSTVKLYEFYNPNVMAAGIVIPIYAAVDIAEVHYMIEYNSGTFYFPKRKDFRYDNLAYILSDNKDIEKKIEDELYKYDDMPAIIEEYNQWYENKNK